MPTAAPPPPAAAPAVAWDRSEALEEWTAALRSLIERTERWANGRGWGTTREPKAILEGPLGSYSTERLRLDTGEARFLLDPIGRYLPGGDGLVDFGVVEEWDPLMLIRQEGDWWVHGEVGQRAARRRAWSEETLDTLVTELSP